MDKTKVERTAAAFAVVAAGLALTRIGLKALAQAREAEQRTPKSGPPYPTPERVFRRVAID